MSRNGNDFSARFPSVANALSKLPDDSIVDGEIVVLDETGRPSFNVLQNYNHTDTPLQFYAFDLLHLAGKTLRDRPLDERRELLRAKLMSRMLSEVLFSETLKATAVEIVAALKKQGLEGVIAKRRDSRYEPGRRSGAWVKMRINKRQELVIGGYVPSAKELRRAYRRLLRARRPHLRCARRGWFRPGVTGESFRALPQARNQDLPLFEFAPTREGQVGSGSHG